MRWNLTRYCYLAGTLLIIGMIATALILEHKLNLLPCPLCIMQRICLVIAGFSFFIAILHNPKYKGRIVYSSVSWLFIIFGGGLAIRQLWLQTLPPTQAPACLPGLDYMLQVMPLHTVIQKVLSGTADCAIVQWTFLNLSMAAWSLVGFVLLGLLALIPLLTKNR